MSRIGKAPVTVPSGVDVTIADMVADRRAATPSAAAERALVWAPLRSVASWYLWRLTDGGEI